jgi:hypothetical protein
MQKNTAETKPIVAADSVMASCSVTNTSNVDLRRLLRGFMRSRLERWVGQDFHLIRL